MHILSEINREDKYADWKMDVIYSSKPTSSYKIKEARLAKKQEFRDTPITFSHYSYSIFTGIGYTEVCNSHTYCGLEGSKGGWRKDGNTEHIVMPSSAMRNAGFQ